MILAPDAPHRVFETDEHNQPTCPIWDGLKIVSFQYPSVEQNIHADGNRYYSSRAGGSFLLMKCGAALLESRDDEQGALTDRQKINLSYWIYQHNLEYHLLDELSNQDLQKPRWFEWWANNQRDRLLKLDQEWVEGHRDCTPPVKHRTLTFLRELIRSDEAGELPLDRDLQMAAGGYRGDDDLTRLYQHALKQEWISPGTEQNGIPVYHLNHSAHIYVDEQPREQDSGE